MFKSLQQHLTLDCGFTASLISFATIVAVVTGTTPAQAALLADWRFDTATNQLQVTLKDRTTPRYFFLDQPTRIVLDLPNTKLGEVTTQKNYSGAVRSIRVSQFQKDVTRIVLELSPEVLLAPERVQLQRVQPQRSRGDRWLLRPGIARQSTPTQTQKPPATLGTQQPAIKPIDTTLPPATFSSQGSAIVSVPPLRPQGVAPRESGSSKASALSSTQPTARLSEPYRAPVIEFGQPLPKSLNLR